MNAPIGFMQGRLSPLVNGRIQAFPEATWRQEFEIAGKNGLRMMEWTLDQDGLYDNPLMTPAGQAEIRQLCARHGVSIPSLTGDCFMQAPFWKASGDRQAALQRDFLAVATAAATVGISLIVVPLVDQGRLDLPEQEESLIAFLTTHTDRLAALGLKIIFESDFTPQELSRFINRLDAERFGINYDIGNSASLGFDHQEEFAAYGGRIVNVHVKDRVLNGTTVPLGTGNARFPELFQALKRLDYRGHFILQTARAVDDDHLSVLLRYRNMTAHWWQQACAAEIPSGES
ncbi:MAG: sugar phosphate isomerase/epimerase [Magnetococcales bacterium]|nr:sugar phosphate isomerase/epimerase [Magnetococcales bacterium]